ncbi:MarR family winged helix-turn-helix transcriptional regulator [Paenibacillus thalictri]|nr:MarR family winged helix-turn-helix transcriptional regulator [Paenibacillus thalictri]
MNRSLQISQSIQTLYRSYSLITERLFFNEYKLTKPQMSVIGQIYKAPKTIGQISEALQLSYSTVSGIIDRLERDEWIKRVRDQSDRRVIWIEKTEKLSQIRTTLSFFQENFFNSVLEGLDDEELDKIIRSLNLLNSQLEKKAGERV